MSHRQSIRATAWLPVLVAIALGGCSAGVLDTERRVQGFDDDLAALESRLAGDPSACLDYIELCELAQSVCVQASGAVSETCGAIVDRCQVNTDKYCAAFLSDGGGQATDGGSTSDGALPPATESPIPIVAVSASSDDGHVPTNVIDGDLATRWSAFGDGQHIELSFAAPHRVTRVEIAFYSGDVRDASFDVALGVQGSLQPVLSAQTDPQGRTLALVGYPIDSGAAAGSLRITGHGNTVNDWNSITEVRVFGVPAGAAPGDPPPSTDPPTTDPAPSDPAPSNPPPSNPPPPPPAPSGNDVHVSNAAELSAALAKATGGERILLASGSYGPLSIDGRAFGSLVTIASKNGARGARLGNVQIANSSYVRLQALHVAGSAGNQAIFVDKGSHHVEIIDCDIHGPEFDRSAPSYEQATMRYVIRLYGGSHHIRIEGNTLRDAINGPTSFGVSNLVIKDNDCDWVASDCFKFGGVDQLVFEGNVGARHIHSSPTAHVDFVQAQGLVTNAVLRGNVAIMGTRSFQGIFFGSEEPHENVLVENNLIYTGHIRAISFNGNSINITARNNTVLTVPGVVHSAALIIGATVKQNNVEAHKLSQSGSSGSNLVLQYDDPSAPLYYNDVYSNPMAGAGATLADFVPVAGGPAACGSGIGAQELLCP